MSYWRWPPADFQRGKGSLAVTRRSKRPEAPKWAEKELENHLQSQPWLTGQDLLIIGRQVRTAGGIIDLLAVDVMGVIHIMELKVRKASASVTGQVLSYRHAIKKLDREELIGLVADGRLQIDLEGAFERHFDRPLPETVNSSQTIVIVAKSFHPQAAGSILELLDLDCSVDAFRYVHQSDGLSLIACCRTDGDVANGFHLEERPAIAPRRVPARPRPTMTFPVDDDFRRFWEAHAGSFKPFATFTFIYERYEDWVRQQQINGVRRLNMGQVGRDLAMIVRGSEDWVRVFVPHAGIYANYNTVKVPASTRAYRALNHDPAYQCKAIARASEL
jgi:hypothetical protein